MFLPVFIGLLFAYGLVSARLEKTVVTAPIVFTVAGIAMFAVFQPSDQRMNAGVFLSLAEIGLVLLLFTDASRTDLKVLRNIRELPARLLSAGMLLTILLGALAAKLVFPQISWWEAGILSAILAPTDAGLGQIIVNSPLVPMRVRQALNVEAGLNDGLSVPFLLFFIAMAAAELGDPSFARFIGEQLGLGIVLGAGIGLAGGWLLESSRCHGWLAESFLQLAVVSLPVLCMLASEQVGASMFIAAFVCGLCVQVPFKHAGKHSVEFTEEWGQILNLAVFFLFGMLIARDSGGFGVAPFIYACRGRSKTGQRRNKTGLGDGTKPDFCVSPLQLTGDQRFEGEHPALSAGYGSAGEQPERWASPKGLVPPERVLAQCLHALRIPQQSSPLAACEKLRRFGGRASKDAAGMTGARQVNQGMLAA